jgi:hypothetical protein
MNCGEVYYSEVGLILNVHLEARLDLVLNSFARRECFTIASREAEIKIPELLATTHLVACFKKRTRAQVVGLSKLQPFADFRAQTAAERRSLTLTRILEGQSRGGMEPSSATSDVLVADGNILQHPDWT